MSWEDVGRIFCSYFLLLATEKAGLEYFYVSSRFRSKRSANSAFLSFGAAHHGSPRFWLESCADIGVLKSSVLIIFISPPANISIFLINFAAVNK